MIKSEKGTVSIRGKGVELMADYIALTKTLLNELGSDFIITSVAVAIKLKDIPADTIDLSHLERALNELEDLEDIEDIEGEE